MKNKLFQFYQNYTKKPILVKIIFLILVFSLILPAILPLFHKDFFRMHDYTHVARLYEMDKALKDGHFPVRWVQDLGWGYGMPLFNFYAPLPYYFAEIFHLLGFSFLISIKIIFGLTFLISFAGMYLLVKQFFGKQAAFLSAIAFVYSPYRAVDFYVRGALGELFAISLIPWAIWSLAKLTEKKSRKTLALASFILACLFLSHTVLTLMCLPALFFITLFFILVAKDKIKSLIFSLYSFILGFGLASFFLIPAFFERKFTKVSQLTQGFSHYSHHFLYFRQFLYGNWGYGGSVDSIPDLMSFHLGKIHLFLGLWTLTLSLSWLIKHKWEKKNLIICFFAFLISFFAFLSTYHAKFIWDTIPLMSYIQFPWRFNSLIIVFLAFLTGGSCFYLEKITGKKIAFLFLLGSVFILLKANIHYFQPEKYISANDYYYTDENLIKKRMSGIIPDYIPIDVKKDLQEIAIQPYKVIEGKPSIKVVENKTQRLILGIENGSRARIQVNRFYFPGWKAWLDNKLIKLKYKANNGIIYVNIPKGNYLLNIKLTRTKLRLFSEIVSLLSLLILGGLFVNKKKLF